MDWIFFLTVYSKLHRHFKKPYTDILGSTLGRFELRSQRISILWAIHHFMRKTIHEYKTFSFESHRRPQSQEISPGEGITTRKHWLRNLWTIPPATLTSMAALEEIAKYLDSGFKEKNGKQTSIGCSF